MNPISAELRREARFSLASRHVVRLLLRAAEAVEAAEARADQLRRLAKEATNGWACYAKRKIEHEDIARLHHEIDAVSDASTPPSPS